MLRKQKTSIIRRKDIIQLIGKLKCHRRRNKVALAVEEEVMLHLAALRVQRVREILKRKCLILTWKKRLREKMLRKEQS